MISKKTVHAIELCVLLAGQRSAGYMTTMDLSPRLDLSISYLENILKSLKDHALVLSMKGPGGGYMIRGDISRISMWDVACVFETTLAAAEGGSDPASHGSYELELEQVVIEAMHQAFSDGRDFGEADLISAAAQLVPLSRTAREQLESLQQWASGGRARPASSHCGA